MRQLLSRPTAFLILVSALLATGCQSIPCCKPSPAAPMGDRRHHATLWFHSAESTAMYLQSFAQARQALDAQVAQPAPAKPRAIVTDIDETVLDNSPYQVWLIQNRQPYSPATWKKWTALASAAALPGASNFLNYASSRGVAVFYVTNRDQDEADATLKNLRAAGFPNATSEHLFCKRTTKGKEDRRQEIARRYSICLLLGDNLSDFSAAFDTTVAQERAAAVTKNTALFGSNWIVFPNPMYGDWEKGKTIGASGTNAFAIENFKAPKL